MYLLFPGASHRIARNLIKVTGTQEIWTTLRQQSASKATPRHLWKEVLGLIVCNLAQTMLDGAVDRELGSEDRQDILEDFVMEILRSEKWIPTKDGAERMDLCMEVLEVAERLKAHFNRTRVAQGLKPRPEAVRDLLFSLGLETEIGLQKTLLALVDTQHQRFVDYFKTLLEPFVEGDLKRQEPDQAVEIPVPEVETRTISLVVPETEPVEKQESPADPTVNVLLSEPIQAEGDQVLEPEPNPQIVPEYGPESVVDSVDLDSFTIDPLSGLPFVPGTQNPMGETPSTEEPPVVVEEIPSEVQAEESTAVEPLVETDAPVSPEPSPMELSIQPLIRPRRSLGRSVDPQKLAKVLEYLLSPTDGPIDPASHEFTSLVGEGTVEKSSQGTVVGGVNGDSGEGGSTLETAEPQDLLSPEGAPIVSPPVEETP